MKVVVISDTHCNPIAKMNIKADILIHCGDFSYNAKTEKQLREFLEDFSKAKAKHKIFIAGNHDFVCERLGIVKVQKICNDYDITYLEDSIVEVGGLKIYGSPYTPQFGNWAFMRVDKQLPWGNIPTDLDILITHGPAYGTLDECGENAFSSGESVGSKSLAEAIKDKKPRYHLFGHIHRDISMPMMEITEDLTSVNASVVDESYKLKRTPVGLTIEPNEAFKGSESWFNGSIFKDWYDDLGQYLFHPECVEESMADAFMAGYEAGCEVSAKCLKAREESKNKKVNLKRLDKS